MNSQNKRWSERAASSLRTAADDLEKFSLKARLGKMEAIDLYEKFKKQYSLFSTKASARLKRWKGISEEKFAEFQNKMRDFNDKTKSEYETENVNGLSRAIRDLRTQIRSLNLPKEFMSEIETELEKFSIKLKIVRLRVEGKRVESKQKFMRQQASWRRRLVNFRNRMERMKRVDSSENIGKRINLEWQRLKRVFS